MSDTVVRETPGVSGGYPCIGNTRVRVALVVQSFERTASVQLTAYMFDLTPEQVEAAMAYYRQHPGRVHEDMQRNRL